MDGRYLIKLQYEGVIDAFGEDELAEALTYASKLAEERLESAFVMDADAVDGDVSMYQCDPFSPCRGIHIMDLRRRLTLREERNKRRLDALKSYHKNKPRAANQ